jgi:hypothetical protein
VQSGSNGVSAQSEALQRAASSAKIASPPKPPPSHPQSLSDAQFANALLRKDPVQIRTKPGVSPDGLDQLGLFRDTDDVYERVTIERILADAETEPELAAMVQTFQIKGTLADLLEAGGNSETPRAIAELMSRFGVGPKSAIADVGCGFGWGPVAGLVGI